MDRPDFPDRRGQVVAIERQRRITELVNEHGYVRGRMLAEMFGVTDETIRRDLMQLEGAGIVRRSHGGAVAPFHFAAPARKELHFDRRLHQNEEAKIAIASCAAEMVADGSTIIIDSGSTTIHLARALREKHNLVVVTNAVTHAVELMQNAETVIVLTGGVVRRPTFGASGELAVATLRELAVDQVFLATDSISLEGGLMYPEFEEVAVKRAMISAASEVILLADHTKFNERSLVRVAPVSVLSRVVTDSGLEPETATALRDQGIDVVIVRPDGGIEAVRADDASAETAEAAG